MHQLKSPCRRTGGNGDTVRRMDRGEVVHSHREAVQGERVAKWASRQAPAGACEAGMLFCKPPNGCRYYLLPECSPHTHNLETFSS